MNKIFFTLLLSIAVFVSCNNKSQRAVDELKPYFDLKQYFTLQADSLEKASTGLQKKIMKDGITEEIGFTKVNWIREIKPFLECDINKPSWNLSYLADTVFTTKGMTVKYIAKDASLPVKQITLSFKNSILAQIVMHKESTNSYYHSTNNYIFEPETGFMINGSQDVMLAKKTNYSIVAKFIK